MKIIKYQINNLARVHVQHYHEFFYLETLVFLNGSQLAKMKKVLSLHVPATKLVGKKQSKKLQLYFKNYEFCEYT